jgi:hypothetical protein
VGGPSGGTQAAMMRSRSRWAPIERKLAQVIAWDEAADCGCGCSLRAALAIPSLQTKLQTNRL